MANAVITHSPSQARSIDGVTGRLRRLRGRITTWFVVDGSARIVGALILLIFADLLIDWFFEMDRPQRIVMLCLMVACIGWLIWRFLVRPLRRHVSEDALCLQVERRHRQLGESLISALQFSRQSDFKARGVSPEMVAATIDRGITTAETVTFEETLHRQRFLLNLGALAVGLAALVAIAIGTQVWTPLSIWWKRNVLLDNDTRWPQKTVFIVEGAEDNTLTIPKGDNWQVVVRVDKDSEVFPETANIEIRRAGRNRVEEMAAIEAADKPANGAPTAPPLGKGGPGGVADGKSGKPGLTGKGFHYTFPQVFEEFEFRVTSSSGRSDWIQVKLVDRPEVSELKLAVTDPAYAGGRTRVLETGRDKYYVLKGASLRISGTASKPLAAAELMVGGRRAPLEVDGKNFSLRVPTAVAADQTYEIRLIDQVKIRLPNSAAATPLQSQPHTSFELKLREDAIPKIKVRLVGVGAMVIPGAVVPCEVDASDDLEVSKVRLKYEWQDHSGTPPKSGEIPLDDLNKELAERNVELRKSLDALFDKRDRLAEKQRGLGESSDEYQRLGGEIARIDAAVQQAESQRRSLQFTFRVDLKPLKIAENSNLRIRFEVDDNDTVSGPKTGVAIESLEVVDEATLRNRLLELETRQRDLLEKKRDEQDELFTKTSEILARVGQNKDVGENDRKLLQKLHTDQQRLGRELKGITDAIAAILLEYRNNRITAEENRLDERQKKIVDPLKKLIDKEVPAAAKTLMQVRGHLTEPAPRNKALTAAAAKQAEIREELNKIIAQMAKSANFQKAVNRAYQIRKAQQDLLDQLNELLKKQLNKLPGS